MIRAVIYCRCSTEEDRQAEALKKQVEEARICVIEQGWTLVDEFVESKSGTTSYGRLEYRRLFNELVVDKFDIIVIKSQDRLMRNTKDWYLFLDRMQSSGKRLYLYIERKFFSSEDSLITGIKAILAEEYSRELSKKVVNAHRNRQKDGQQAIITNRTFGYDKLPNGKIIVNEAQREACIKLFKYVVQYGCRTTSRLLEAEGILSKSGNVMSPATIRRIVMNPMYKGTCIMNKQQFDFETKKVKKIPKEEWIYAEGIAPPIVSSELWQCANDAIIKRSNVGMQNRRCSKGMKAGKYVLSGKLICGLCGKPYYRVARRTGDQKAELIYEWKCSGYLHAGRKDLCPSKGVIKGKVKLADGCDNVHLQEDSIFGALENLNITYFQVQDYDKEDIIHKAIDVLEKVLSQKKTKMDVREMEHKLTEVRNKKQMLLEKLLSGVVSDTDYQIQNKKYEEEICQAESDLLILYSHNHEKQRIIERLEKIRNNLESGGLERAYIRQMLDHTKKIIVYEWQMELHYRDLVLYADIPFSPNTEKGRYLDRLKIFTILKENPYMTIQKIADCIGRSRYVVCNRINELKQEGYICYCGAGGKGFWKIMKEFYDMRKRIEKN